MDGIEKLGDISPTNFVNLLGVDIELIMSKDVPNSNDAAPVDFGIFSKPLPIGFYVNFPETFPYGDEHHCDGIELIEIIFIGRKIFRRANF